MKYTTLSFLVFLSTIASSQISEPSEMFSKYEIKSFNTGQILSSSRTKNSGNIQLQIDRWNLTLEYSEIVSSSYKSIDQDGSLIGTAGDLPIPMQGFTSAGGNVSLTIGENFIYGFIEEGNDRYYIEPARYYSTSKNLEEFIIYNTKDIKKTAAGTCGFIEVSQEVEKNLDDAKARMAGECFEIEYAVCNDWSIVNKYGGANEANAHTLAVINDVNTNYSNAFDNNYKFVVTGSYNSTCETCDPVTWTNTTNSYTLLANFVSWGQGVLDNSFSYDVASLWSNRDFDGSTIGLAYVGTVCGGFRYNVLQDFSTNADQLRVLTAHELGHNCGANHDNGGSPFVMAPSIPNASTSANIISWSAQSISQINTHLGSRTCLSDCTSITPVVSFVNTTLSTSETESDGSAGSCGMPFRLLNSIITISNVPQNNVVASIEIGSSSTATVNYDFDVAISSVTFTSNSALQLPVSIRIYDDEIEEAAENIVVNLSITSGDAILGNESSQTVTIESDDLFNPECCVPGDIISYGESEEYYIAPGIFDGGTTDGKSRMLFKAAELNTLGITAGYLDLLGLYISVKGSTGVFNDFRIGLAEVVANNLNLLSWVSTTQVFIGDVTTNENVWNNFSFQSPFLWDGNSNIYVEFCFNNANIIGTDEILFYDNASSSEPQFQFNRYNNSDGCAEIPTGGDSYTLTGGVDVSPVARLRQSSLVTVETTINASSKTRIRVGETANMISDDGKIIATILNTGGTEIGCITTSVNTEGSGKSTLPFGSGEYSDKSIYIDADNAGSYDLTLYYNDNETSTWGNDLSGLSILKSDNPLVSSSAGAISYTEPNSIASDVAATNSTSFTANFTGSGYFAMSNGDATVVSNIAGTFEDADLVIDQLDRGVIVMNGMGDQYLLSIDGAGNLIAALNNSISASVEIPGGDLCLLDESKALYIRRNNTSFAKINVNNQGELDLINTSSLPPTRITLESGYFGLMGLESGIIFLNSENECHKLYVDDNGELVVGIVTCP